MIRIIPASKIYRHLPEIKQIVDRNEIVHVIDTKTGYTIFQISAVQPTAEIPRGLVTKGLVGPREPAPRAPAKPKPLPDIPTRFRVDPDNPKLPTYEWYRDICLLKIPNASDDQIQRGYEEVYKDVLPKQPDKQPEPPPFKPHELPSYNDYRENAMGVWGAEFSEDECEESYRRKGGIPKLD